MSLDLDAIKARRVSLHWKGEKLVLLTEAERDALVAEVERLQAALGPVEEEACSLLAMLTCPFFVGTGTCVSGCRDEPACQTNGPWDQEIVTVLEHLLAALHPETEDD